MRSRVAALLLALTCGCADLGAAEYELVEEEIGGTVLDAESAIQRFAIRACYAGPGDPDIVVELSPWIDAGEGEVEALLESTPELSYALDERRSPVAPLVHEFDADTACETGVVARLSLATPSTGKSATVAWVIAGRAIGDDPVIVDGTFALSVEPL